MNSFANKVAIITGAGQGIGKAIAQAFSHHEVHVIIADNDEESGKETQQWIEEKGGTATFIPCDVAQEASIKSLIHQVMDDNGRIDFLINNAGVSRFKPIRELSVKEFDEVLTINLRSAFIFAKYAEPLLRKSGKGAIVNIASTRALMSEPDSEAYAASKGGILALTHALANSLAPDIRVNAISPGWIEVRDWKKTSARQEVQHREIDKKQHLVGRVGTPEDIGRAAVFLCSGELTFMTGQNMVIDGGMTVKMMYEE
ncbi:SDR family NAD(P)-dependent oxidoreductase [Catalinimonas niigatensis]|uniref:SDR family NAD(P)-dependent oxidoreductase n=1 Tax=Catalinimonas niigatensis TaxID=1397264 RepID=UPI0026657BAD|nr:glucose 1-dehydrogenase [Catalinimonas niigatensis]WPP53108.1 SDR family oxidoreductase [Catalinimonas niigatensis]